METPICFAHRGARAHARENTIESFNLALRLGASGLETDAWVTRDGKVVLDHDGVVRRMGRKIPISRIDRDDLPVHIPALDELLNLIEPSCPVSIDIKDDNAADLIIDVAKRCGYNAELLWLCFPGIESVLPARKRLRGPRIVDSSRLKRITEGVERRAAILAENGVDALNMHHTDWTGGLVTLVHRFGILAFGWDLQHDHVLEDGFRMGLDAVYSDHVDKMVESCARETRPILPGPFSESSEPRQRPHDDEGTTNDQFR